MVDDGICKCDMCGFQWVRGHDGSHSCAEKIKEDLICMEGRFQKVLEACEHLVDEDCIYNVCDLRDDLKSF